MPDPKTPKQTEAGYSGEIDPANTIVSPQDKIEDAPPPPTPPEPEVEPPEEDTAARRLKSEAEGKEKAKRR